MLGPEFSSLPLRLQVMVIGMSPWETAQVNWANAPESTTSEKENGAICGGSKKENGQHWLVFCERSNKLCKSGGSTAAPPVNQAVCGTVAKNLSAVLLHWKCLRAVGRPEWNWDLQQTVCEQTAGYEIHRNQPISIRHRIGLNKTERDGFRIFFKSIPFQKDVIFSCF